MDIIYGKGVSAGVVAGPLYIYHRGGRPVEKTSVSDTGHEWERFLAASKTAAKQLGELAVRARTEAGNEAAFLFEAHQMMAEDVEFAEAVKTQIHTGGLDAETAVQEAARQFVALFEAMNNEYMRARAADVKDVADRLIRILSCEADGGIDSEVPVVLAADDLMPSETIRLDKSKILGFVTSGGSENGHTAILARMLGIPAIIGVGDALKEEAGKQVFMDGETGEIVIDPDKSAIERMERKQRELNAEREQLATFKALKSVTKDGRSVQLCCNIGSVEEVDAVREVGGEGIGLFRTELVFLRGDTYPTEEEQFEIYRTVASQMAGKRVVFRTLDVGADKQADYFSFEREENPAMGLRGIRFCLTNPEILRTQLRALYRASSYGKIAVMFPMITHVWEIHECKRICGEVREELKREGILFDENVELGVMIETPAAVMISDLLAKEVEFFSVGTNDLTQYMLASDRQNERLEPFFDQYHQAVLRAIRLAADNAHREGRWIGICGELAADPKMTERFFAMGIDELSVSPGKVLPLRKEICEMDASKADALKVDVL